VPSKTLDTLNESCQGNRFKHFRDFASTKTISALRLKSGDLRRNSIAVAIGVS
jgi:hypothetical protein